MDSDLACILTRGAKETPKSVEISPFTGIKNEFVLKCVTKSKIMIRIWSLCHKYLNRKIV